MFQSSQPGFLKTLLSQLESQSLETLKRVNRDGGIETRDLVEMLISPKDFSVFDPEVISPTSLTEYRSLDLTDKEIGHNAIVQGKVAYCILAGGAGTRIGSSKALLPLNKLNTTLLGHKLAMTDHLSHVWIMTSPSTHSDVVDYVMRYSKYANKIKFFQQYESFRLTPDNQLFLNNNVASLHPCGHGDLIPALQHSGILQSFLLCGGEYIAVTNVDNVLFTLDEYIVGRHIASKKPITCEVTERLLNEGGGILCRHQGIDQIVELFRILSANISHFQLINTNSMIINANLDFSTVNWSWHRVKKKIDNQLVVQYERLLQDLTATFQTQYINVPRELRFMPIKNIDDLQAADQLLVNS